MERECYFCEGEIPKFNIAPVLELPNGELMECCPTCADREFPNWREEE